MQLNVGKEVSALMRMTIRDLRIKYGEVFGDSTNARNKAWLVKRIAWRIQANAFGTLADRAVTRAVELANDADLRLSPPKLKPVVDAAERTKNVAVRFQCDERLPMPGTILTRKYKRETIQVKVLPRGFEYEGEIYKSLSAVAKAITGQHCNGFHFFRLGAEAHR